MYSDKSEVVQLPTIRYKEEEGIDNKVNRKDVKTVEGLKKVFNFKPCIILINHLINIYFYTKLLQSH